MDVSAMEAEAVSVVPQDGKGHDGSTRLNIFQWLYCVRIAGGLLEGVLLNSFKIWSMAIKSFFLYLMETHTSRMWLMELVINVILIMSLFNT